MIPASSLDKNLGQITRSRGQNRSNFEIVTTPSIFQLERQTKARNVRKWTGYLDIMHNFR